MARIGVTVLGTACAVLLAGCSSSANTATTPPTAPAAASTSGTTAPPATTSAVSSPTAAPSLATVPSQPVAPSGSATTSESAVPTALDPCQLVTSAEASSLAGTTFGDGTEETSDGGGKQCFYGGQTMNVFSVEVAQAPDAATAQAAWSQEEAEAQDAIKKNVPAGITVALTTGDVTGLGDRAATISGSATISGQTINASGIYVLKGATFFAFQDLVLGKSAPAPAALQAQARATLGRVP